MNVKSGVENKIPLFIFDLIFWIKKAESCYKLFVINYLNNVKILTANILKTFFMVL